MILFINIIDIFEFLSQKLLIEFVFFFSFQNYPEKMIFLNIFFLNLFLKII